MKNNDTTPKDRMKYRLRRGRKLPKHLEFLNMDAAGIDLGAAEHYVSVPEDRDDQPVRRFKCFTPDLHEMALWLKACDIKTVAMEATGVYWMPVYGILEEYGLEVYLVNARHIKYVPGRKTDVLDCQWLQQLHTYGLLSAAFVPDADTSAIRTYWRHRKQLVESCCREILRIQKAMTQMNLQLHNVISDITGVTGMKIIRAIVAGERDPIKLAQLKHRLIKSSTEEIAKALTGYYRAEHVFCLTQALELYDIYQQKIADCDREIECRLQSFATKADPADLASKPSKKGKRKRRKNEPHFDLRGELYRMTGVDLTRIDGIDAMTAFTIITECGFDMSVFPGAKNLASWLGLCPNNVVTGGKIRKRKTKKVINRAAQALRIAAQSLHRSASYLGAYHRRQVAKHGPAKAITNTAHKLARLIYRILKYGQEYVDKGQEHEEKEHEERQLKNLIKRARKMGYEIVELQTGEVVS